MQDMDESEAYMKVIDKILAEKQKMDFGYIVSVTGITNEQMVDFTEQ